MLKNFFIILQILGATYFVYCAVIKIDSPSGVGVGGKKSNKSSKVDLPGNDLTIGECKEKDKIIYSEDIHIRLKENSTKIDGTLEIVISSLANITCVKLLDQNVDGNGGKPRHISGGPGYKFVEIGIEGTENHEVVFKIFVLGEFPMEPIEDNLIDNHV